MVQRGCTISKLLVGIGLRRPSRRAREWCKMLQNLAFGYTPNPAPIPWMGEAERGRLKARDDRPD